MSEMLDAVVLLQEMSGNVGLHRILKVKHHVVVVVVDIIPYGLTFLQD